MAECDVQQLMTDGRCFACLPPEEQSTLELALLYQWAESTQTVQELMDSAECFACRTPEEQSTLELQLLCEILNAEPAPVLTATPEFFITEGEPLVSPFAVDPSSPSINICSTGAQISYKEFAVGDPEEIPTPGSNGWSDYADSCVIVAPDLTANYAETEIRAVALEAGKEMSEVGTLVVYNQQVFHSMTQEGPGSTYLTYTEPFTPVTIAGLAKFDGTGRVLTWAKFGFAPSATLGGACGTFCNGVTVVNNDGVVRQVQCVSTVDWELECNGDAQLSYAINGPTRTLGNGISTLAASGGTASLPNTGSACGSIASEQFGLEQTDSALLTSVTGSGDISNLVFNIGTMTTFSTNRPSATITWNLPKYIAGIGVYYQFVRTI